MRSESALIERIRAMAGRPQRMVMGIGDDCAIYRPSTKDDLLFTTDLLVEDVHFRRDSHPADAVGHKALARGLSDIAAMGGTPKFCLLSLAAPPWMDDKWLDMFYRGLLRLAKKTDCPLVGGDLGHAEKLMCDIVVCGAVPRGKALRREGARPGDSIWVSGRLGGSALGLEKQQGPAWKSHLYPKPRLDIGLQLRGKASATMDLSDGLSIDLHRLCSASGVSAELDREPPRFAGAAPEHALHGGEDYELLFTLRSAAVGPKGTTRIGAITPGNPGAVHLKGERLEPLGYDHFRK
jgi:thiamine-monophosphate kinase